ncbi:hypothetical protein JCM3774_005790, partial [Rhodotorula dairenensis]
MALVDYGSDSDSELQPAGQPQPARSSLTAPNLAGPAGPTADDDDGDDGDADEYNPQDAFGLARIAGDERAAGTGSRTAGGPIAPSGSSAPQVIAANLSANNSLVTRPTDNVIYYNASYADLTRPVQGPANPWDEGKLEKQNTLTGHVEQQHYSDLSFKEQQRSYQVLGYAANPSIAATSGQLVGDLQAAQRHAGTLVSDVKPSRAQVRETRRKRKAKGHLGQFDDPDDNDDDAEQGGAAGGEGEEDGVEEGADGQVRPVKRKKDKVQREYLGPWAGWEGENLATVVPTEEEYEEQEARGGPLLNKQERRKKLLEDAGKRDIGFGEEKSIFH